MNTNANSHFLEHTDPESAPCRYGRKGSLGNTFSFLPYRQFVGFQLLLMQENALLSLGTSHLLLRCRIGLLLLCSCVVVPTLRSAESTIRTQDGRSFLQASVPGDSDDAAPGLKFLLVIDRVLLWQPHTQQVFIRSPS